MVRYSRRFRGPPPSFSWVQACMRDHSSSQAPHNTQESKHKENSAAISEHGTGKGGDIGERTLCQENHAHHLSTNQWSAGPPVSNRTGLKQTVCLCTYTELSPPESHGPSLHQFLLGDNRINK